MPVNFLISARNFNRHIKGGFVAVLENGSEFGSKEGLLDFCQITVTDRTPNQIKPFNAKIVKAFDYSIVSQNATGVRGLIEVDKALSGTLDKEFKQDAKGYILAGADVTIPVTVTGGSR